METTWRLLAIFGCIAAASQTAAAELDATEHHTHGSHRPKHHSTTTDNLASAAAHVHGQAELLIVQDGEHLQLTLISAAMDVLGFEQAPSTPAQKTKLEHTEKALMRAHNLFVIEGGQCHLDSAKSLLHGLDSDNESSGSSHAAIESHFAYLCTRPEDIEAIEISLFDKFPSIAQVNAQWVIQDQQSAASLTAKLRQLNF